ncbi:MAG: hypothetical protein ACM3X6_13160 [Patescibacteria group bacterium]
MRALLKRYRFFLLTLIVLAVLYAVNRAMGAKAVSVIGFSFKEMLLVIPPIFLNSRLKTLLCFAISLSS